MRHLFLTKVLLVAALARFLVPFSALAGGGHDHGHGHGHGEEEHEEEPEKGPHGGRLLTEGNFSLEVTIFERGVPPEYRLYAYESGEPVTLSEVRAEIQLTRFGDKHETFAFSPKGDHLSAAKVVEEPHSFEVKVSAEYKGKQFSWHYDSFEGRTELSENALKVANLEIEVAGPTQILNSTRVFGRIVANEDRVAHLGARYPGIIKEIRKSFGDRVEKGEVLAVIESNQNLQPYELRTLISGVVIQRHATLGEVVSDSDPLFIVADLSEVRADFQVYRDDIGSISVGQKVLVDLGNGTKPIEANVAYVSPVTDEATQSKLIRAILPNPKGELRPGLFLSGLLTASETSVPLAVKREAIQTFRDWNVVFVTDGHVFQAMPVELGRRDSKYVEVLSGIEPGHRYVSKHSYIIKADIEKSGASHDH